MQGRLQETNAVATTAAASRHRFCTMHVGHLRRGTCRTPAVAVGRKAQQCDPPTSLSWSPFRSQCQANEMRSALIAWQASKRQSVNHIVDLYKIARNGSVFINWDALPRRESHLTHHVNKNVLLLMPINMPHIINLFFAEARQFRFRPERAESPTISVRRKLPWFVD
jgi:hypothetical protein